MQTDRPRGARGQVKHVAHAEKTLRPFRVEDGAGVEARTHLVGDPAREVGLDHAGHDVNARALGGEQQVDPDRARHLGQVPDRILDLVRARHHQVGQLVDDDHDERQGLELLGSSALGGDAPHLGVAQQRVVLREVPHLACGQQRVAFAHLAHGPAQGLRRLLGIRDDGCQQVRQLLVNSELDLLRVDEDEAHLLRRRLEQDRHDHGVDADALARAREPSDEQVRHALHVGHEGPAVDVLAERQRERGSGVDELGGLDDLP